MSDSAVHLSLMPPLTSYRNYLERAETDSFCGRYAAILSPYKMWPSNSAAAVKLQEVARQIYAAAHEGMTTAFLQCHQGAEG